MKRTILISILVFSFSQMSVSQSMQFVFAGLDAVSDDCTSDTECLNNQVCYYVEYTPNVTGTLTSYTMGFIGNCTQFGTPVLSTSSCVMNNNSSIIDGCDQADVFLLQVSGNGIHEVVANEPVNVGQICFQLNNGYDLELIEDETSGITTSVNLAGTNDPVTEFLNYTTQELTNEVCNCFKLTSDSGSPTQDVECLQPIIPIKYQLNNCDTAMISNLAPGLTTELINGVINIEGAPTHGGAFTFLIQAPSECECNPSVNNMEVDSSIVMIFSKCYTKVEDAISEYNSGETIDILGDVQTKPSILQSLNNVIVRIHKNTRWDIKE